MVKFKNKKRNITVERYQTFFSQDHLSNFNNKPSLTSAFNAQDVCARAGFDFGSIEEVMKKVLEEITELEEAFEDRSRNSAHFREEIGDAFFVLVNLARHAGIDPETLVKENVQKYLNRCGFIEKKLQEEGREWTDLSKDEISKLWKEAKNSGL